ncbi:HNH endonuclease [Lewinella sp. IMCC34191]|uniref:HNH endonuclease n=1 Tax=Lewinella sp. IMCC34191 TaxID=2259172 RepID=UPI003977D160
MNTFKSPNEAKITSRISSITNVFVNSIIPNIRPPDQEIHKVYEILELDEKNLKCAYCRVNTCTEWDHFRPTVKNKKPTGYLADIYNLVPACGKCNQSKRGEYWRDWIVSSAKTVATFSEC